MITPSLEELLDKTDSKYSLVVAAAKRARQIIESSGDSDQDKAMKAVSLSLADIASGRTIIESQQEQ